MSDYEWFRSSFCASGACVEVSLSSAGPVLVRDSKLGEESPLLGFTSGAWARALEDINDGYLPDYAAWLANGGLGWGLLQFTAAEWDVFEAGVKAGEFDYDKLSSGEAGSGFRGVARSGQAATGAGAIAVPPVPVADQPPRTTTCGRCHPAERCSCQDSPVPVATPELLACDCPGVAGKWGATGRLPEGHVIAQVGTRSYLAHAVPSDPVAAQPRYILDKDAILELVHRYGNARAYALLANLTPDQLAKQQAEQDDLLDAIRGALTPVPDVEPEDFSSAGRIWVLAGQPGREVTAVRDDEGDVWERILGDDGPDSDAWALYGDTGTVTEWPEVLHDYGPLTDATVERNPSSDADAELLAKLAAAGARTTTCPCGYGPFDSCPVHDNPSSDDEGGA